MILMFEFVNCPDVWVGEFCKLFCVMFPSISRQSGGWHCWDPICQSYGFHLSWTISTVNCKWTTTNSVPFAVQLKVWPAFCCLKCRGNAYLVLFNYPWSSISESGFQHQFLNCSSCLISGITYWKFGLSGLQEIARLTECGKNSQKKIKIFR